MIDESAEPSNGRPQLSADELRRRELEIIDGPLPAPIPPEIEARLRALDPTLAETLNRQAERCHAHHPCGRCMPEALCPECQLARRYLALVVHRDQYGRLPPPLEGEMAKAKAAVAPTALDIIITHFRRIYDPVFKRGNVLFSRAGREVRSSEACLGPDKELISALMSAVDVPKADGEGRRSSIPGFFKKWAPAAWREILKGLDEEPKAAEVSELAREQFRTELAKALKRTITLGGFGQVRPDKSPKGDPPEDGGRECRTVIAWCNRFAKGPRWGDVRGRDVWCCRAKEGHLRIALRVELFTQIGVSGVLVGLTQKAFSSLCELYDCGESIKVSGGDKRAVELSREFIADLLARPEDGQTDAGQLPDDGKKADDEKPRPSYLPDLPKGCGEDGRTDDSAHAARINSASVRPGLESGVLDA
jgi:hypothetical protein